MRLTLLLISILFLLPSCGVGQSEREKLSTENTSLRQQIDSLEAEIKALTVIKDNSEVSLANTQTKWLSSKFNQQEYQIKIKLPRNYESGNSDYPVLYITDAETNFGGVSYIVQRLIKDGLIPEIIVVGIAYNTSYRNFYRLRSRDLTPSVDPDLRMGGMRYRDPMGGANKFADFLEKELFPFIDKNYRTNDQDRAIYGHSFGGLFGSHLLLHRSDLFNRYLLLGPSLWWDDELLLRQAKDIKSFQNATRFYMASGELEHRIDDLQEVFITSIEAKNPVNLQLKSEVMANETHRTIFGPGFTNGLRFIYQK